MGIKGEGVVFRRNHESSPGTDTEDSAFATLGALWEWRAWIAAASLVAAVTAGVIGLMLPREYAGRATLVALVGQDTDQTQSISAALQPVVSNQAMASEIVQRFKLGSEPNNLTPAGFLRNAMKVELVPGTALISLTVRLRNPDLAAQVANAVAERSVELARVVNLEAMEARRRMISEQLKYAEERFRTSQVALETFKKQAQVEMSRKDADGLLEKRGRLATLNVEIAAEQARLAKAQEELARHDLTRPAPSATNRETLDGQMSFRSDAVDAYINPVHEYLDAAVSESQTKLAAAIRERDELQRRLGVGAQRLKGLSDLYEKEATLEQLATEYDIAKKAYVDFATRYEAVRIEAIGRDAQLVIIDKALPPELPVSRNVARNALLAGLIAFLIISVMVLVGNLVAGGAKASERPARA